MKRPIIAAALLTYMCSAVAAPLVIAHRGASGYLPEHTLEAAAYAHALGADFIEQDVVLSRDNVVVVSHDIHVDTTTDVAVRYPQRKRADGRFYAIDFTWEELQGLRVKERFDARTGQQVFPKRFPSSEGDKVGFRLCTLDEQLALIAGLNRSTGRSVGVYVEIKAPAWHRQEGREAGMETLKVLASHGYSHEADNVFVQCFDPSELKRLREQGCQLRMIQLLGDTPDDDAVVDYTRLRTPDGLREIATYAQGIGPHLSHVFVSDGPDRTPRMTTLVADAHAVGLLVHPYTFRSDALPAGVGSIEALLERFIRDARVDGVFIDHPDAAVRFLAGKGR